MKEGLEQLTDRLVCARFCWLAVIYAVGMLCVWHLAWPSQERSRDYLAAVAMVHNHRIVASDLKHPDGVVGWLGFYMQPTASLEGKYVTPKDGISPPQPVNDAVLTNRPDMTLPPQTSAVVLPAVDAKMIGLLDAGSPVTLFGPDTDAKAMAPVAATVHAILCDIADSGAKSCYPVVRVAEAQAPLVLKNLSTLKLAPASLPSPQKTQ